MRNINFRSEARGDGGGSAEANDAVDALKEALQDENYMVHREAARALEKIQSAPRSEARFSGVELEPVIAARSIAAALLPPITGFPAAMNGGGVVAPFVYGSFSGRILCI